MTDTCFSSLLTHAENLDAGIRKLTEIWRYPHEILGGFGADEKLADTRLQALKSEINALKEEMVDSEKSRSNDIATIDKSLKEWQNEIDDLVGSCNQIETVLSEYGYVKPENESPKRKVEIERSENSSLISSDVTDDLLEVEFTPDMTWRHRAKTNSS